MLPCGIVEGKLPKFFPNVLGVLIWSDDMLCETSKQICHNWNVALLQKFSSKKKYPSSLHPPFYSGINIFA
jgi:hypothetical protein